METPNLGENLAREWAEEPRARELWDALKAMTFNAAVGLKSLEKLAEAGAPLAMMRLGYIYVAGQYGVGKDALRGEQWLRRSADAGSVEGKYRLAKHLQVGGRASEALLLYHELADRGYTPAMYNLGLEYYLGEAVEKDIDRSLIWFGKAAAGGHLHGAHWVAHILMEDGRTAASRVAGFWRKLRLIVPMMRYSVKLPNSDFLRK